MQYLTKLHKHFTRIGGFEPWSPRIGEVVYIYLRHEALGLGYEGLGLGYEALGLGYEDLGLGYEALGLGHEVLGLGYEVWRPGGRG